MKKLVILTVFLLGLAINAAAIKVFLAWGEVAKDCIHYILIVTEDDGRIIGNVSGFVGKGCEKEYNETGKDSPISAEELTGKYPEVQRAIDDAYMEYQRSY